MLLHAMTSLFLGQISLEQSQRLVHELVLLVGLNHATSAENTTKIWIKYGNVEML